MLLCNYILKNKEEKTMKGIVVEKPGVVTLKDDIPEPKLSSYSAIVENIACGICNGTDLKIIDGHFKGFDTYPAVLGHESVGRVIEIGQNVHSFKKGDYVLRTILDDVGPQYYSGWGSFSEYSVVYDYQSMVHDGLKDVNEYYIAQQVIPSDIDPIKGTMIITFKEVYTGLKSFGVDSQHSILINGCGPVGLSMIRFASLMGVRKIFASDIDQNRLDKALHQGAHRIINPQNENLVNIIREEEKDGLDLFIDAVGINSLMNIGLNLVKFNGKIGVYGISPTCFSNIDWSQAPYNWTIQFVQWPNVKTEATLHNEVIDFVRHGKIKLDDFVSHALPLEDFQVGLDLVKNKKGLKVVLLIRP